ncbi:MULTISPECIES: phytanoyl-CoA dioxygenase family protein [Streptomyces]|uniref:Leucine hydroxylase n=1 Tax=Streptomyces hawaiiensis TaxID=67305 RepID=A0A5B9BIV8_9ACTN|nr:phytanoyl-CoA dioxygenase family protein [Streptomyces hawaiiensis]QCD59159.1 phytanoyl-CoA dioxygenase [Streptomyces hawaiiensis]QED88048.1 leucine hydroxylase [Streptomyces hawaiiensis]
MQLAKSVLDQYDRDGFVLVPGAFSPAEMDCLKGAMAEDVASSKGPHLITEDDGATLRAVYASHTRHPLFSTLVSSARLLAPAMQLVAQDLYVHQFKINTKRPFGGESWAWHQDYPVWRDADRMPEPRAVNVAVFLDEVTEFNGPVVFLRGSHRLGSEASSRQQANQAGEHIDPHDYALSTGDLSKLAEVHEMTSPKGPAGTVVFFHPEIMHGSAPNISPFPRDLLIVTYNASTNAPRPVGEPRPEYLVGRDVTPLVPNSWTLETIGASIARAES